MVRTLVVEDMCVLTDRWTIVRLGLGSGAKCSVAFGSLCSLVGHGVARSGWKDAKLVFLTFAVLTIDFLW